jgi:hypothetical protein
MEGMEGEEEEAGEVKGFSPSSLFPLRLPWWWVEGGGRGRREEAEPEEGGAWRNTGEEVASA